YERLGDMHSSLGHLEKALQYFEERSRLGKELYEKYPQNVVFKNGLAISYFKLGEFYRDQKKDLTQAKKYFQQCCNLWKELTTGHPDYAEFQKNFDWVKNALEEL
ncbi:MAG: tetratricopeptide repeat protein, partial [Bacteroidota bacterium]